MTDCDFYCIGQWVLLLLWYLSVPVYIVMLYTIVKYRQTQFNGSFWSLTLSLGIADLSRLVHVYWTTKLPMWGWIPWITKGGTITAWFTRVLEHYFVHAEFIGVLLISINRYTALTSPLTHELKWTKKSTTICLIFQWFLPCVFVAPIVPLKHVWFRYPNTTIIESWLLPEDIPTFTAYYFVCFGLTSFIRVVIYGFLYGKMCLSIRKYEKSTIPTIVRPFVDDRKQKERREELNQMKKEDEQKENDPHKKVTDQQQKEWDKQQKGAHQHPKERINNNNSRPTSKSVDLYHKERITIKKEDQQQKAVDQIQHLNEMVNCNKNRTGRSKLKSVDQHHKGWISIKKEDQKQNNEDQEQKVGVQQQTLVDQHPKASINYNSRRSTSKSVNQYHKESISVKKEDRKQNDEDQEQKVGVQQQTLVDQHPKASINYNSRRSTSKSVNQYHKEWISVKKEDQQHKVVAQHLRINNNNRGSTSKGYVRHQKERINTKIVDQHKKEDGQQKKGRINENQNKQGDMKTEFRLMLVGLGLVLVDFFALLHAWQYQAYSLWWPNEMDWNWWKKWDFRAAIIGDVFGWINAWLLLMVSNKLRGEMKKVINCGP